MYLFLFYPTLEALLISHYNPGMNHEKTTRESLIDRKRRSGLSIPFESERADVHRRAILGIEVKGLELVQRAQDRPHFENSYSFIFPNATADDVYKKFDSFNAVSRPRKGNIIFYMKNGQITHVGKLVNEKTVISKWGRGHVYEHPIGLVPESYGDKFALRASFENQRQVGPYTFYEIK